MKIITALLAASVLLASCHQYQKTKSGLVYKITSGGNSQKLKQGDYVKMNIEYKMGPKDTILNSTFGHLPSYIKIDTAQLRAAKHNFTEVIMQCASGDKMEFVMNIDTLKKLGMIPDYNPIFAKRDVIKGRLEILKVFASDQEVNADFQKEMENEKQREITDLGKYISGKGIKAQKSTEGVYVDVKVAGTEPKADTGRQVAVFYKGYTVNGKVFDANMGAEATHKEALSLVLGKHSVIPGWEIGLKYFGKGGKGTIYVPAMLAYGAQGQPPVIAPFTNLIFDVEVTDITAPTPQAPGPQMPQMPQHGQMPNPHAKQ
jgi:FKBP-type peptidyl-prolyl cis-trans isomerase